MTGRRRTSAELDHASARCLGCSWATTSANAQGTAARHHDATGHAVTVTVQRTITYGDPQRDHPALFPED